MRSASRCRVGRAPTVACCAIARCLPIYAIPPHIASTPPLCVGVSAYRGAVLAAPPASLDYFLLSGNAACHTPQRGRLRGYRITAARRGSLGADPVEAINRTRRPSDALPIRQASPTTSYCGFVLLRPYSKVLYVGLAAACGVSAIPYKLTHKAYERIFRS